MSKRIERTVARQCDHYLATNHLYPKLQAAYQQYHSPETALVQVRNDILRATDEKKEVILVLLDLSAAFDTINHNILLSRLQTQYGFTDTVIKWFESYLQGRSQRVVIGGIESNPNLSSLVSLGAQCLARCFLFYTWDPSKMSLNLMVLTVCCTQTIQSFMLLLTILADNPPLQTLKKCISDIQAFSQIIN